MKCLKWKNILFKEVKKRSVQCQVNVSFLALYNLCQTQLAADVGHSKIGRVLLLQEYAEESEKAVFQRRKPKHQRLSSCCNVQQTHQKVSMCSFALILSILHLMPLILKNTIWNTLYFSVICISTQPRLE